MPGVFEDQRDSVYSYRYGGTLLVHNICGGTPTNQNVAEGWLRSKLGESDEQVLAEMTAQIMVETGADYEAAKNEVLSKRHLVGFRRDEGGLFISGHQLKACLKEAANIRWPSERWGPTKKGTKSYIPEHIFVVEEKLYLGVQEPDGVRQRFVHTWRSSGITYEEYVREAKINFTILTDLDWDREMWGQLWVTAEQQGLGASRSMGNGRFEVVRWEQL